MRAKQFIIEYYNYDIEKMKNRLLNDESSELYADSFGNFYNFANQLPEWLEQYDPTQNNKYVNWMITRYLNGGIRLLEDIPAKVAPALVIYAKLAAKKKLQPEHRDINQFKDINQFLDAVDTYKSSEDELASKSEKKSAIEQQMYSNGDAELVFNDPEYKVVIPHSHKASCYFGKNTRWCTTSADDARYHNQYSEEGPLYIILHKPTNKRWQFHFESQQYMNEKDENIEIIPFLIEHKKIFGVFKKLGIVDYKNDSFKIGKSYFNNNGKYHRTDGPAVEYANGIKEWYLNGKLHRTDGPAIERPDGTKYWYLNGKTHRTDGPAVEYANGIKEWWVNGKLHRTDGPAIEYADGTKYWYLNGKTHRTDGPAIEYANGTKEWWVNGKKVDREDVMGKKKS